MEPRPRAGLVPARLPRPPGPATAGQRPQPPVPRTARAAPAGLSATGLPLADRRRRGEQRVRLAALRPAGPPAAGDRQLHAGGAPPVPRRRAVARRLAGAVQQRCGVLCRVERRQWRRAGQRAADGAWRGAVAESELAAVGGVDPGARGLGPFIPAPESRPFVTRRVVCMEFAYSAVAELIAELFDGEGFALPGELLLPVAGWPAPAKITKSACPSIRPGAERRVPSLHRCSKGPALPGRPWPHNAFRRLPAAHPSTQRLRSAGSKGAVRAPEPLG